MTIEHEGVQVTATNFRPSLDELKVYVDFVKARVDNVTSIKVTLCDDNEVDIQWTAHNQRFERIRRITGQRQPPVVKPFEVDGDKRGIKRETLFETTRTEGTTIFPVQGKWLVRGNAQRPK